MHSSFKVPNYKHIQLEGSIKRASTVTEACRRKGSMVGKNHDVALLVAPLYVDFGTVLSGKVVDSAVHLRNMTLDLQRFNVRIRYSKHKVRPEHYWLKCGYSTTCVAPGMECKIQIELHANSKKVNDGPLINIRDVLEIKTEVSEWILTFSKIIA